MKHQALSLAVAALATSVQVAQADIYKFWCGRKYNATAPSFAGYNSGSPMATYDQPHGDEYHSIKVVQGSMPYETGQSDVSLVAYVPQSIFDANGDLNLTISVPMLGANTTITADQAVNGVSFSGRASDLVVGKNRMSADASFTQYENGTAFSSWYDTVFFDFWTVEPPKKEGGKGLVALNTLDQSVSVNGGKPFYPIGYYVSNSYMFSGDYAAAEAAVKKYASEGYNVLMHGGAIGSNATQLKWTLELCDKYDLYYQCDVTDMTQNLTALGLLVSDFAYKYKSFMSYYIGNEPDGNIGVGSLEPIQSQTAYEFLKVADPYHPVTLVTNCAHTMPVFAPNVDYAMTDVYAVGIPTEYNGLECTPFQGDCGCDLCDGSNPVKAIFDRWDLIYEDLGVQYPAMWLVEQTFYDNTSYWSRPPTYQEELAMAWASVVAGGSGVLGYTWPVTGVPTKYPQLGLALSDFASQMSKYASDTAISGPRVAYSSIGSVYYASWGSGTVVAMNTDYKQMAGFAAAASELGLSKSSVKGQGLGRSSSSHATEISVHGGLLMDQLSPLEIKVYQ